MKTLLLSTSSLWNCGDDFIRDGVLELLCPNDDVRTLWWNRGYGIQNAYANDLDINLALTDYFIVAGTPKWVFKNEQIYRYCLEKKIPMSLIGVGTRDLIAKSQYDLMKKVAASGLCEVCLTRDRLAHEALKELGFSNVEMILDPCFFKPVLTGQEKKWHILSWREQYNFDVDPQLLSKYPGYVVKNAWTKFVTKSENWKQKQHEFNQRMIEVFNNLPEPKIVTVHDNREVSKAQELFGKDAVFYSTDSKELFKKYAQAKSFIGTRIHGAVPSFIHGTPVHLIYTTEKAGLLNDAAHILSQYDPELARYIHVDFYSKPDDIKRPDLPDAPLTEERLVDAIGQEKKKTYKILKAQPILSTYMQQLG